MIIRYIMPIYWFVPFLRLPTTPGPGEKRRKRMKKNRILCGLLALALAVSLVSPALAAGTPTVSISSGEVKAGESVTLTVSIKDNPGLATCMLYIYYDTKVFEVDPAEDFGNGKDVRGALMGNTIAVAKKNGQYHGDAGKDGALVLWYSSSGTNVTGNGSMLTVTLHVASDAPNGTYTIGLGYSELDTLNEHNTSVELIAVSGEVVVTGGTSGGTQQPEPSVDPVTFLDVNGHWAYDYIEDAAQLGLMEGYQNLFRPDASMTRCEFVTALWRAMGKPAASKAATFTDLDQNWYLVAVAWAQENNIIQGTGGTKFEPYWPISREQVAVILHRLAGTPTGMEMMLSGTYDNLFQDSGKLHSWAKSGVYWAVYQEVYCGTTSPNVGTSLAPTSDTTRAQIAVMLVRYLNIQGGV